MRPLRRRNSISCTGDDSKDSDDSRFNGPVPPADVVGRAWVILGQATSRAKNNLRAAGRERALRLAQDGGDQEVGRDVLAQVMTGPGLTYGPHRLGVLVHG